MQRRLLKLYTGLNSNPYRVAFRFLDFSGKEVIEIYKYNSFPELVSEVLPILSIERETFYTRLCEIDDKRFMNSKHKTRRYISDTRELLYIASPHLTQQHSTEVGGHWVATNIGRRETLSILTAAAVAAGVTRRPLSELLAQS